jgi:hypothetical protein
MPPKRKKRRRKKGSCRNEKNCAICGLIVPHPNGDYQRMTCGSIHCLAALMLMPRDVRPPQAIWQPPGHERNKARKPAPPWRPLVEAVSRHIPDIDPKALPRVVFDLSSVVADENLTADLRGFGSTASQDPWGHATRKKVAFRVRSKPGSIFLHVKREPEESSAAAVRRTLGASADIYDFWLLWRCSCAVQAEYRLASLGDLPDDPGPYGNCPGCGATPIFIEVLS